MLALVLAACAAGVNPAVGTPAEAGEVAGFVLGAGILFGGFFRAGRGGRD